MTITTHICHKKNTGGSEVPRLQSLPRLRELVSVQGPPAGDYAAESEFSTKAAARHNAELTEWCVLKATLDT